MVNAGFEVNFSVHLQTFARKIFSTSKLVRLLMSKLFPDVWETWMILTRKCLLDKKWIFFSLADYQNHSHYASLRVFISSPATQTKIIISKKLLSYMSYVHPTPFQNHISVCIVDKMNCYMQNNTYDTI